MQIPVVMTVIGRDRPGLVDAVAGAIADQGGNWLESRMSHLGGQFAGILRIRIPSERESLLQAALKELAGQGITVVIHRDEDPPPLKAPDLAVLELVGQDRPGIVRQISHALARFEVNLEELCTECESAPMTGENLFKATARLRLPTNCELAQLQAGLEKIAADLMVDLSLTPVAPATEPSTPQSHKPRE